MTFPKCIILLCTVFAFYYPLSNQSLCAQSFVFRIPVHFDVGMTFTQLQTESNFNLRQLPGLALELQSGVAVHFKERICLMAEAGYFLNNYTYVYRNSSYNIAQFDPRLKATIFYLSKPINSFGSRVHIGMGWGYSYYARDTEQNSTVDFSSFTYSTGGRSMLISPEIGLSQITGKSSVDLLLAYNHHLDGYVGMVTEFESAAGTGIARSRNNHLALRLRFYFGPKSKAKKPAVLPEPSPQLQESFATRKTDEIKRIETKRKHIRLKIYDNADEDGDIISVRQNGKYVLTKYEIKKKKKVLKLSLEPGPNEIVVFAHNEGLVPPNTASCLLKAGWKSYPITITTSLKRNQSIAVIRQ